MLNHIVTMGRLVRDPELRHTQSGIPVTSFTIACDRDYKDANGDKATDFIDVVAWRNTADFVSRYFTKGRMAVIDGRLQLRDLSLIHIWTDIKWLKELNVYIEYPQQSKWITMIRIKRTSPYSVKPAGSLPVRWAGPL